MVLHSTLTAQGVVSLFHHHSPIRERFGGSLRSEHEQFDPFRFEYKIAPKAVDGPLISEINDFTPENDSSDNDYLSSHKPSKYPLLKALIAAALALLALSALSAQPSNNNRALPPPLGLQGDSP